MWDGAVNDCPGRAREDLTTYPHGVIHSGHSLCSRELLAELGIVVWGYFFRPYSQLVSESQLIISGSTFIVSLRECTAFSALTRTQKLLSLYHRCALTSILCDSMYTVRQLRSSSSFPGTVSDSSQHSAPTLQTSVSRIFNDTSACFVSGGSVLC